MRRIVDISSWIESSVRIKNNNGDILGIHQAGYNPVRLKLAQVKLLGAEHLRQKNR